jgi:hypothetical protein
MTNQTGTGINLIPWPPKRRGSRNCKRGKPLTASELAEICHEQILNIYPAYGEILKEAVSRLSNETVLLNLNIHKTPPFLLRLFEEKLEIGRRAGH